MMCQYRLINYNKCITLMGMLIMREAVLTWGQRVYRKSLDFPFNFAQKNKVYFKNS